METVKRRSEIMKRPVGKEYMLYDAVGRKVHVLNETAHFVWELCDGTCSIDDIVSRAAAAFDASPDELRADIEGCLKEFRSLSLLE